jgi:hypothetical protein
MYTNTQKRNAYLALPSNIKDIISSEEVTDKIVSIGDKHNLLIDKQGVLVDEIGLVMFGLTHPDKFVESIKNRLEISQADAEAIATDVNNEILLEIREELKKISAKNAEEEKTSNLAHDSEHPIESDEHHATLKREDILRDIEDPAPITPARTVPARNSTVASPAVAKTSPSPSNLPVAHNDNDLPAVISPNDHSYPTPKPVTPKNTPVNIVTAKLGGVVVTATTVIPQKPATPSTPQAPYKADPYRETF